MASISSKNSQKTIFHSLAELYRSSGRPFALMDNSTINQHLGITVTPVGWTYTGEYAYPKVQYLVLGRGGAYTYNVTIPGGTSEIQVTDTYKNACIAAVPFDPIPLACYDTTLSGELSAEAEASQYGDYRLRKLEEIGGVTYVMFYGLKVDLTSNTPEVLIVEVEDGAIVGSPIPFDPAAHAADMQNPAPKELDPVEANLSNGRHILIRSTITTTLTEAAIDAIVEACTIKYGVPQAARVTEAAIYQGVDYTGASTGNRPLAVGCQPVNHIRVSIPMDHYPSGTTLSYGLLDSIPYPLPAEPTDPVV